VSLGSAFLRRIHRNQRVDPIAPSDPWVRTVGWFGAILVFIAVLLSFGPGHPDGFGLPFNWCSRWIPGFRVIRVPARFGVLAQFGLVLLAVRFVGTMRRQWIGGIVSGLMFIETGIWPATGYPLHAGSTPPEPYALLASDPDGGPIAEFPFAHQKYREMFYSCYHWRPLVNGISGYLPPGRGRIDAILDDFPTGRSLDLLHCLGVRDIVIHGNQPEWNHGPVRRGSFHLTPRFAGEAGHVYGLSMEAGTGGPPEVRCDIPRIWLAHTSHTARLHFINTGDTTLICIDSGVTVTVFAERRETMTSSRVFDSTLHLVMPESIPPGAVWTIEFMLPPIAPGEPLAVSCEWQTAGPSAWTRSFRRTVDIVERFDIATEEIVDPDSVAMVCAAQVVTAGQPAGVRVMIDNRSARLWTAETRLMVHPGTDERLAWKAIAVYPEHAGEVVTLLPVQAVDHSQIGWSPEGDVMPGTTAFCFMTLQPPPWPGEYHLVRCRGPDCQSCISRYVFLGPERPLPVETGVIVHQNPGSAGWMCDGNPNTVWRSQVPVFPDTSIHLIFSRPRRVQGLRLYAGPDRLPAPTAPSILLSEDGSEWRRIVPESIWNMETASLDIWFPPEVTQHAVVHAGVMMEHPWEVSELTLF
ncbi:hypothetical protein JXA80_06595, partial [bacterium]|nr:hypothetical protein [candidate division CSSED10-310 bacterium]